MITADNDAPGKELVDAVLRLDEQVAQARRRVDERQRRVDDELRVLAEEQRALSELEAIREAAQPFIKIMRQSFPAPGGAVPDVQPPTSEPERTTLADQVVEVFRKRPTEVLTVDDVLKDLIANGTETDTSSVRNAVYYAERRDRLRKEGRGRFALLDTSAPDIAGAEANEDLS